MNTNDAICESAPTTVPAKRQMNGLYALKPWFTRRLTFVVNAAVAREVSPDVFTAAGVAAAGAAGVAIAMGCWPLAVLFLVLRLAGAPAPQAVPAERRRVHISLPRQTAIQDTIGRARISRNPVARAPYRVAVRGTTPSLGD
jgi:hypothetical protein